MRKSFRILKFKKSASVLEVKKLSKSFDGRPILRELSLKVFPGEIVGLLGPNGAGKSTLFNIIIGAETSDSGDILINGKSIIQTPIHLRSKLGLGYMPQTRSLFETLSCRDNLLGLIELFEKNDRKAKEQCDYLLETFNLTHLASVKAGNISGGEGKRLQLARLMINKPKIVLLDESLSHIDPIHVQQIQNYIIKIQSLGVACILTEHALESLFSVTDRNYLINEGQIVAEGTKKELLKNSEAVKNYFGVNFTK